MAYDGDHARRDYHELIARKKTMAKAAGFEPGELHSSLKPHQRHSVEFALRQGRAALFLDTGLGKTFCALEWGRAVVEYTGKPVLLLCPLAVGPQHEREAERWGIDAKYVRGDADMSAARIWITNYEQLKHIDCSHFAGVILDESSILKSFTGKTTRQLIETFQNTPYRLACTATPAPNDHMELGQHAEFLGVMPSNEMLSRWFISDQTQMGAYRLKRGAVNAFWEWVASWSRMATLPSDVGGDDSGYILPSLNLHKHVIKADISEDTNGLLFRIPDMSATSIHAEKRRTVNQRASQVSHVILNSEPGPWVVWCDTDYEADALKVFLPNFVEVRGSQTPTQKESGLVRFSRGEVAGIITKPSIAGFGLNWQHCNRMAFVGLSFSYESFYQAIRRCWRFGQTRPVDCHIVMSDTERAIYDVIARKKDDHEEMKSRMTAAMKRAMGFSQILKNYNPEHAAPVPAWLKECA